MAEPEMESSATAYGRYRALLKVSSAIATQPNLQAVLQSLRDLLSKVVCFDSVGLLLLEEREQTVRLLAVEHGASSPKIIEVGTELSYAGTSLGRAIEDQRPVFVADPQQEILKIPQLASLAGATVAQSAYVFPIS